MKYVALAQDLARQAGEMLAERFGESPARGLQHKGAIDLVTQADRDAEALILAGIRQAYPAHAILAEESGSSQESDASVRWVVDPLDGTVNFAHGLPMFAVLIAVQERRGDDFETVAAVTYEPLREEMFCAVLGGGATLNGATIRVSKTDKLINAVGSTGFTYTRLFTQHDNHAEFCRMNLISQGVRRFGSAGLDLAYLACGRFDYYWEYNLNPWDVLGGMLLVREAGGTLSAVDGSQEAGWHDILATNGHLHAACQAALHSVHEAPINDRNSLRPHLPNEVWQAVTGDATSENGGESGERGL